MTARELSHQSPKSLKSIPSLSSIRVRLASDTGTRLKLVGLWASGPGLGRWAGTKGGTKVGPNFGTIRVVHKSDTLEETTRHARRRDAGR